jgi:hypothetical protein
VLAAPPRRMIARSSHRSSPWQPRADSADARRSLYTAKRLLQF